MRRLTWIRAITLAATAVTVCAISACEGREAVSSARALPASSSAAPTTTEAPASTSQQPPSPTTAAPESSSQPAESATPVSEDNAAAEQSAAERLGVTDDPRLGPIVTDQNGMTVYRLKADGNPGFTPVLVPEGARVEVDGIDPDLVGADRRPDGGMQLAIAGASLYRFTGDSAPGDTNGHGADGVAFAITPTGERAGATR